MWAKDGLDGGVRVLDISQVFDELMDNPYKKFRTFMPIVDYQAYLYVSKGFFVLEIYDEGGNLIPQNTNPGAFSRNIQMNSQWEEVESTAVSWAEAFTAWARDGSGIRHVRGKKVIEFTHPDDLLCLKQEDLLFGLWYIIEEE